MMKSYRAIDIKWAFTGRTLAFRRFYLSLLRVEDLADAGLSGLSDLAEETAEAMDIVLGRAIADGSTEPIKLDKKTASVVKSSMRQRRADQLKLRFHFYSLLVVAVWGAFESYFLMLFDELYRLRPQLLKSDETITFRDVVDYREGILDHLIERQQDRIGHFGPRETFKYLEERLNFSFSKSQQEYLLEMYLIRNIIAHNTGIVGRGIRRRLPESLFIENDEIRVSKAYLYKMIKNVQRSVIGIEKHVIMKFYKPEKKWK